MAAINGDICIKFFAFAVNSIPSPKKKNKKKKKKKQPSKHTVFNSSTFAWFVVV